MNSVSVALLPSLLRPNDLLGATAIVIDVLRATTVMTTAIANGARRIVPCETIDEAKRLGRELGDESLLCGERGGLPIEDFDLGNSPAEYNSATVRDKTLVMTTTNGTKALIAVNAADQVLTASFLNRSAVVQRIRQAARVLICCAGTDGEISREDVLLAGAIVAILAEDYHYQLANDSAQLAYDAWKPIELDEANPDRVITALRCSQGGRNLERIGHAADIVLAGQIDTIPIVPTRTNRQPLELRFARQT